MTYPRKLSSRLVLVGIASALCSFLAHPVLAVAPPGPLGMGEGGYFTRGDADGNGELEITDAIFALGYLFLGSREPPCLDAADTDDDGVLIITDAIAILGYLFNGSTAIPPPFPDVGTDPSGDSLGCDNGLFGKIRREVFAKSCALANCHTQASAQGGLVLEGLLAYGQLYGLPARNEGAAAEGLLRVAPGDPEASFLFRKISGMLGEGFGDPMPKEGAPLTADQIELVRSWIALGAAPSVVGDIRLPVPERGEQIVIEPFRVPITTESGRNYYFKLKTTTSLWVDRIEILSPPGCDTVNIFSGDARPFEDGFFEDFFRVVSFSNWTLRASSQGGRLDWKLPPDVAIKFNAREQLLIQIHFANVGPQLSPVGGCAVINFHATDLPHNWKPLGSLFIQNRSLVVREQQTVSLDTGISFDKFDYNVPVTVAAVTGHFHWRGKSFEVRLWDGLARKADGTPALGEFDRMGPENTIYRTEDWRDGLFKTFDAGREIPSGWGVVYRATYENTSFNLYCNGPRSETQEHSDMFLYFYPAPDPDGFFWFPPECLGQGCTVPCF